MEKRVIKLTKEQAQFIKKLFDWSKKVYLTSFQAVMFATGLLLVMGASLKILFISVPLALLFLAWFRSSIIKLEAFERNLDGNKYYLSDLMEKSIEYELRLSFLHKKPIGIFHKEEFDELKKQIKPIIGRK